MNKQEKFISKSREVHKDRYEYSLCVFTKRTEKVKISCKEHGVFEQLPGNHLAGNGCPKCFKMKFSTKSFIEKSKKKHGDKYDYSLVNYIDNETKVKIVCPNHGVFEQTPHLHTKHGCKRCSDSNRQIYTSEDFVNLCTKVHGHKYDYIKTDFKTIKDKIKIICPKHGCFEQIAYNHLSGHGCSICRESRGEREIRNYLSGKNIKYVSQFKFIDCKRKKSLPFDFYLPDLNIMIEYDGEFHFKPIFGIENLINTKLNDSIKNDFCEKNNIKLIRISYNDKIIEKLNEIYE